jgi:PAS domain S-box-containing protein
MSPDVPGPRVLRVLLLEDSQSDAELLELTLQRAGYLTRLTRVENEPAFRAALSEGGWDLVVADYNLPAFSGLGALSIYNQSGLDAPFFLVSGTVGEELAVHAMRAGAHDYLLKDSLVRLGPAVARELREMESRRQRKADLDKLVSSEERFRLLIENSCDLITEIDGQGRICYASPNHEAITGYAQEHLLGQLALSFVHGDDVPQVQAQVRQGLTESTFRCRFADGTFHWLDASGRSFRLSDQRERSVVVSRDVSERIAAQNLQREREEQLRRAQRLEALGRLAGGIAHDFNNILTATVAFTEMIHQDAGDADAVRAHAQELERAHGRAADLVRQILAFSRQQKVALQPTQIGAVIAEALRLVRSSIPSTIGLELIGDTQRLQVMADSGQIHQVIMNLCTNAAHAVGDALGHISLKVDECELTAVQAQRLGELRPGNYVRVSVRDNGKGMSDSVLERVFEPFFTTRPPGQGTGLGLSVVHGIMRDHAGTIAIQSVLGSGTEVTLYFPKYQGTVQGEARAANEYVRGKGEHVLLVDDEVALCKSLGLVMERIGYRVTAIASPTLALSRFREAPEAIDVLVTDLTMPEITGVELARLVLSIRPSLPVVLLSGFAGNKLTEQLGDTGIREVLGKPVRTAVLAQSLRRALDGQ